MFDMVTNLICEKKIPDSRCTTDGGSPALSVYCNAPRVLHSSGGSCLPVRPRSPACDRRLSCLCVAISKARRAKEGNTDLCSSVRFDKLG
jgi:hypothetical protein